MILSARKTIAGRDPQRAPVALVGAAAAAAFLTLSALFDVLSFPHPTYIFLYTAGLVAVVIAPREERRRPHGARRPLRLAHEEGRVRRARPARRPAAHPARTAR